VAARPAAPTTLAASARTREVPKPTLLDAAGTQSAKAYTAALARGRKATLAKKYVQAEEQFSKCLELVRDDPRALAERGYARLLADKPVEARMDLLGARKAAPNSALLLQILHNLVLVEQRLGDERAASAYEAERKQLKSARRMPSGVDCSSDVSGSELEPRVVGAFEDALQLVLAAHAEALHSEAKEVIFEDPFSQVEGYADRLKAMAARSPFPDGRTVLYTSGGGAYENHAVIAQSGTFYVYPSLSSGTASRCCIFGLAEVSIDGGGARPWRIQRKVVELMGAYTCVGSDGTTSSCSEDEGQTWMSSCVWANAAVDLTILDAKTFRGIRQVSVSAHPSGEAAVAEPEHLLEIDWQADHAVVEACGERQLVRYGPE
jgi:hypothetical protein